MRISRSKANDGAPKGGKRILEEERDRRTSNNATSAEYQQFQLDTSAALLSAMNQNNFSNAALSGVKGGAAFTTRHQSLASVHPKSVLEWATKSNANMSAIPSETGSSIKKQEQQLYYQQ